MSENIVFCEEKNDIMGIPDRDKPVCGISYDGKNITLVGDSDFIENNRKYFSPGGSFGFHVDGAQGSDDGPLTSYASHLTYSALVMVDDAEFDKMTEAIPDAKRETFPAASGFSQRPTRS